jgi:hypothetical protein
VNKVQIEKHYGKIPLSFEANQGQTDKRVKFLSRGQGYSLFLTDSAAVLSLTKSQPHLSRSAKESRPQVTQTDTIRMELAGASKSTAVTGNEQLPGTANYFIGSDPAKWHSDVPTYAKVQYKSVYPGIDLVYYGNQSQLEFDFVIAPGANPKPIQLRFGGVKKLRFTPSGDLQINTLDGEITLHKPLLYQQKNGQRQSVEGLFTLNSDNSVGFSIGHYDHSRELVIDPTLAYSTYLGGATGAFINAIAVDASGAIYATGRVANSGLYTSPGAPQHTWNGNGDQNQNDNAFIAKLNAAGDAIVYETYLGGSGGYDSAAASQKGDIAYAIAVDSSGNAYVAGFTDSTDFPYTVGAYQTAYLGGGNQVSNGFVAKLNASGTSLVYSTYLGETGVNGVGGDGIEGIAVDNSGDAYLAGGTYSNNFPIIGTPFQNANRAAPISQANAFVAKLNPAGSSLLLFTYLGGTGNPSYNTNGGDAAEAITLDSAGDIFVAGGADSNDFPMRGASFQTANAGFAAAENNAFVAELNPTATTLLYSTYLGGKGYSGAIGDLAQAIALGPTSDVYVSGIAYSSDFPVSSNALQSTNKSGYYSCSFVARINTSNKNLVYSTYLCGSTGNFPTGLGNTIAVDSAGDAYVTGSTFSKDFPVTGNAFQSTNYEYSSGVATAFFTELNPTLTGAVYSTYLGGTQGCPFINDAYYCSYVAGDLGVSLTLDTSGNAYVAGLARSADFPVTAEAYQTSPRQPFEGDGTSFIAKLNMASSASLTETAVALTGTPNPQKVGSPVAFTAVVTSKVGTTVPTGTVSFAIDGGVSVTETLDGSGHASYSTSSLSAGAHSVIATYSGSEMELVSSGSLSETISAAAATPIISPAAGTYTTPQSITITDSTTGSTIYYTTDGTTPTTASTKYTAAITVSKTETIQAIAVAAGYNNSAVASATYNINAASLTVSLSPTSLTFASTAVGSTSTAQFVTLKNTSPSTVTLSGITLSGANPSAFTNTTTCGTSLAAAASCTISLSFAPTTTGTLTASLSVADNATGSPQTVALTGTGTSAAATVTASPTALTFPTTVTGTTSPSQVVTISNPGTSAVTVKSYTFTGTNASSFLIPSKTCGTTLAAGSSCTLSVDFKPTAAGTLNASLLATDSATGSPQTVALTGTGQLPPTVAITPDALTFPATTLGSTSAAQVITVKNIGTATLTVKSYLFSGADASSFALSAKTCTTSLAVGASCTLTVTFKPTALGTLTASLVATDSSPNSPQTIALTGTGAAQPTVTLTPSSLTFATTKVGTASAAQVVTLTNTGATAVAARSYTFTGSNASSFELSSKTCGTSLAAGESCTLSVSFKPTATGALTGNLAATDNAVGSPQTTALSGTGN